MSVNGTGVDPRTNKPLPDSTSWTVKRADGTIPTYRTKATKEKPSKIADAKGIDAVTAFAVVRKLRKEGDFAAAVRS
jgi:hypothetical protein